MSPTINGASSNDDHQKQDPNPVTLADPYFASDSAAQVLEKKLLRDLKKQVPGSRESIETLKQLVYAAEEQCGGQSDFWWKGAIAASAHQRAVDYATQAIEAQKKLPLNSQLGQVYECAHVTEHPIALPWNADREDPFGPYAAMASAVYEQVGDDAAQLALLRKFSGMPSKQHLQKIELGLKIEGDTSVKVARDITACLSQMKHDTNSAQYASKMARYTVLANLIFENSKPSERYIYSQQSLLLYAGRYFQFIAEDKLKAIRAYERLILVSESDQNKIHYSNMVAVIRIELEQYEAARTQYEKTIARAILSHVDPDEAYFGLCMLEQMTGHQERAVQLWQQHIYDRPYRNEIYHYPYNFGPKLHGYLRTQALALTQKVHAVHAAQIVEQWAK